MIDARTRLVSLLGYPLSHSLSPAIHNSAFAAQAVNMVYVCLPVAPVDFETVVRGLLGAHFVGSNITIPHKERAFDLADTLSDEARAVGAVNTLVARYSSDQTTPPHLYGDNTDVAGFLRPLEEHRTRLVGQEMIVLGSGGAARAVVYALLKALNPSRLTIAARNPEKAHQIAGDMAPFDSGQGLQVRSLQESGPHIRNSTLVVNTTPVGMYPHLDASPWNDVKSFGTHHLVYDLIYNPQETRLLRDAEAQGASTIGGLDMLIYQAAASYVQWTQQPMPVSKVRESLLGILTSHDSN